MVSPARILVTGAAGQIAYSLVFKIARGEMLGPDQPVILHLLDIPPMSEALNGVVMELEDTASPLLHGVVASTNVREAIKGIDYAILCGAFPRKEGMERKDLLEKNAAIFKEQGAAFDELASKNVKVVVVGNPANTNALILSASAPSLPKRNFTALTRLDHNRAKAQIAKKLGVSVSDVQGVIIWGNHSSTQFPDAAHGTVVVNGQKKSIPEAIGNDEWLQGEFVKTVQSRGAAVIAARKLSSAASAAQAIIDHMRTWILGTAEGEVVSMAVPSDGSYGIKEGVIYSFPVTTKNGEYTIVQGLPISEFARTKMDATASELLEEKETAFKFLGISSSL